MCGTCVYEGVLILASYNWSGYGTKVDFSLIPRLHTCMAVNTSSECILGL